MAFNEEDHPSRWLLFVEVRDSLRGVLAPRLKLQHLIDHGKRIARRARVKRPNRPLQSVKLQKIGLEDIG
jgi:hypothetical protein